MIDASTPRIELSARIRPNCEAAPWLIKDVVKLECELAETKRELEEARETNRNLNRRVQKQDRVLNHALIKNGMAYVSYPALIRLHNCQLTTSHAENGKVRDIAERAMRTLQEALCDGHRSLHHSYDPTDGMPILNESPLGPVKPSPFAGFPAPPADINTFNPTWREYLNDEALVYGDPIYRLLHKDWSTVIGYRGSRYKNIKDYVKAFTTQPLPENSLLIQDVQS